MTTDLCEILDWDSAFFDRRIARYRELRCPSGAMAALAAECVTRSIDCVYVLIDAGDTESIRNLQQSRAYLADIRVTFGTQVAGAVKATLRPSKEHGVRPAVEADIPALARLASMSHRDTRFYADSHFDTASCDRLYEVWIEKSCHGFADAVFVIDADRGMPSGYVTCTRTDGSSSGSIGLFAVSEDSQGRGFGKALLDAAVGWFASKGATDITVSTQLRNLRAVRFYAGTGFVIQRVALWFHLWPRDRG